MPKVSKVPLPRSSRLWALVQPGDFIDGYAADSRLTPRAAMETALAMPGWAKALLHLRNLLVRPFGLKTDASGGGEGAIFPVTFEDETEVILGTDDSHLDFRICLNCQNGRVHMATWVRRNNLWGRLYLTLVMPFHILIVRNGMRRIARIP